jgi:hypothetical protein
VIDYTPLPLHWECGSLSFIALQTGKALQAEGAAMHHCVASYWGDVVDGSRIYSILENGSRVATLELTSRQTQHKRSEMSLCVPRTDCMASMCVIMPPARRARS